MKRDIIKEILEKNRRSSSKTGRFLSASRKFASIVATHDYIMKNIKPIEIRKELLKYIPIELVTLMENYFNQLMKDIILSDNKYLKNLHKIQSIKIDISDIIDAQEKSLSIADLMSHSVSTKNLNNIISNLSIILNEDYNNLLKDFISYHKEFNVFNSDEILRIVNRTFELRNIYVHEYAFKEQIKIKEIETLITYCNLFILFSEIIIKTKISSNVAI